jgi:hypothetical protein
MSRSSHSGAAADLSRRQHRSEPVDTLLGHGRQIDDLRLGHRRLGVEPSEPQHVLDNLAQSMRLAGDTLECVAIPASAAVGG